MFKEESCKRSISKTGDQALLKGFLNERNVDLLPVTVYSVAATVHSKFPIPSPPLWFASPPSPLSVISLSANGNLLAEFVWNLVYFFHLSYRT